MTLTTWTILFLINVAAYFGLSKFRYQIYGNPVDTLSFLAIKFLWGGVMSISLILMLASQI